MGRLAPTDPLKVLFFSAYVASDDTDDWPTPLRDEFNRQYSKL
jgi:hypothetical protein